MTRLELKEKLRAIRAERADYMSDVLWFIEQQGKLDPKFIREHIDLLHAKINVLTDKISLFDPNDRLHKLRGMKKSIENYQPKPYVPDICVEA
jgi:hypothetical protein